MESSLSIRGYIDRRANSDNFPVPAPGVDIRASNRDYAFDLVGQKAEDSRQRALWHALVVLILGAINGAGRPSFHQGILNGSNRARLPG